LAPKPGQVLTELARPTWVKAADSVFMVAGSVDTPEQRIMVAALAGGPGSVVSHHTAAALWGVPGFEIEPVHLTRMRGSNSTKPSNSIVHRVRRLPVSQVTVLGAIPIVRPERLLFELADAALSLPRLERVVDRLWADRLLSGRSLYRAAAEIPGRGHRGRPNVKAVLSQRPIDWTPPASGLESRVSQVLELNRILGFSRQVDLGDDDEWIGRVDFVHMGLRIVIEVQSDRYHTAVSDRERDRRRRDRLEAAGFVVIEVWESEVWHRPDDWIERVRRAVRSRQADRAA